VLPFAIAFVFLSALCIVDGNDETLKRKKTYSKFMAWPFLFIVPIFIIMFSCRGFQSYYEAYKQWNKTSILHNANMHEKAIAEYVNQYPYLQDEIRFLFEYALSLFKSKQYEKSNEVLQRAMQISCDPVLYNIMGNNCQALKEYRLAEQSFKKSANLVPSRLYPHYLLAKLYHEMGLKDKAEAETNIVMTNTPKVESKAVEEMREELIKLIMPNLIKY
jgi:tetratricopeptide (TPR) repeat protein